MIFFALALLVIAGFFTALGNNNQRTTGKFFENFFSGDETPFPQERSEPEEEEGSSEEGEGPSAGGKESGLEDCNIMTAALTSSSGGPYTGQDTRTGYLGGGDDTYRDKDGRNLGNAYNMYTAAKAGSKSDAAKKCEEGKDSATPAFTCADICKTLRDTCTGDLVSSHTEWTCFNNGDKDTSCVESDFMTRGSSKQYHSVACKTNMFGLGSVRLTCQCKDAEG